MIEFNISLGDKFEIVDEFLNSMKKNKNVIDFITTPDESFHGTEMKKYTIVFKSVHDIFWFGYVISGVEDLYYKFL